MVKRAGLGRFGLHLLVLRDVFVFICRIGNYIFGLYKYHLFESELMMLVGQILKCTKHFLN